MPVAATVSAGCESTRNPHDHGGPMVDEVRPEWKPKVEKAPFAADYVLFAWHPSTTRPTTTAATRPTAASKARLPWEAATEVDRPFVDRGRPLGFERRGGRLVAVADRKVFPLPAGHYCWHLLPGNPTADGRDPTAADHVFGFVVAAATVVVVVVVVGAVGYLIYHDEFRHHQFVRSLSGDGSGD